MHGQGERNDNEHGSRDRPQGSGPDRDERGRQSAMLAECVLQIASPLTVIIVASVTMNGGIPAA